jgi:hypothetical protein
MELNMKNKRANLTESSLANAQNYWTINITSKQPICLGKNLAAGVLVLKNNGPAKIIIETEVAGVGVEVEPGQVRIMRVWNYINIESKGGGITRIDFHYLPTSQ